MAAPKKTPVNTTASSINNPNPYALGLPGTSIVANTAEAIKQAAVTEEINKQTELDAAEMQTELNASADESAADALATDTAEQAANVAANTAMGINPYTPPVGTKKAIGSSIITRDGKNVQIITFDDGTTQENPLGDSVNSVDASQNLISTFNSYGLGGDIASAIANLVKKGFGADTISLIAQDPKSTDPLSVAYQKRFAGNAGRVAQGLKPLSPAEYLATEDSYAQIMRQAGMPTGFYDTRDSFANFIANDVSPTEVQSRVTLAKDVLINADPMYLDQLSAQYGLDRGHALAHILDPQAALPLIQKQVQAVQLGAAAERAGLGINNPTAEQLVNQGVSQSQANQGFQNIASQLPNMQELATRYNAYSPAGEIGQALTSETFGTPGAANAEQNIQRLKQQEVSQFSGSSGAGKGSLMGTEAGLT